MVDNYLFYQVSISYQLCLSLSLTMTSQIDLIVGLVLTGIALNWCLFGVLTIQVYIYYVAFPKDRFLLKAMVYVVYMLESAQAFMISVDAFKMFATGFGNSTSILDLHSGWFYIPIMSGIIACFSQGFYTYRIFVLSQSRYIPGAILLVRRTDQGLVSLNALLPLQLSLFQLGGGIAIGLQAKGAHFLNQVLAILKRKDTGVKKTHDILTKIIRLTIGTGTMTATLAIVALVLDYLPGHLLYWESCVMVLGKAYSNSMMIALNSRMKVFPNVSPPVWNEHEITPFPNENIIFASRSRLRSNDREHSLALSYSS
ncbi:hypothetical protein BDZ97DRAFT_1694672 [Flammula alnicola]|nr:hypothetical protein BDZ97DRAFT_1694672 [Flammula alnicola]